MHSFPTGAFTLVFPNVSSSGRITVHLLVGWEWDEIRNGWDGSHLSPFQAPTNQSSRFFLTLPYQNGKRTPRIQSCFQKLPSHQEVYCNSEFPFPNLMSKLCLSSSYSIDAFGRKSLTNLILYHLIFKYQKNYTEMRKVVA